MSGPLSSEQVALLRAELLRRQQQLGSRLGEHPPAPLRSEQEHEVLSQDADVPSTREDERAIDLALTGIEKGELAEVAAALRRLAEGDYGQCVDCESAIPFERLKAEPAALRCVRCEALREKAARRLA